MLLKHKMGVDICKLGYGSDMRIWFASWGYDFNIFMYFVFNSNKLLTVVLSEKSAWYLSRACIFTGLWRGVNCSSVKVKPVRVFSAHAQTPNSSFLGSQKHRRSGRFLQDYTRIIRWSFSTHLTLWEARRASVWIFNNTRTLMKTSLRDIWCGERLVYDRF